MIKYFLLTLLLACTRTERPPVFKGLPEGEMPACSWDILHKDRGECIAGGKRFHCVSRRAEDAAAYWTEISCAPKIINPINSILEGFAK